MAIVKKYPARVLTIINSIKGVYTLEFESLGKAFNYFPGQFLHLAIDDDYDGSGQWPESRCFSIQSNLAEKNIKITYSVKGKFTHLMEQKIQVGSEVWLKLPYGDLFTQPHNKGNTVFIAGGTGITPFLSLFTHESFNEYKNSRIYLGFRSKEYNIYDNELSSLKINSSSTKNTIIKIFYQNEDGIIDIHKVFSENGTNSYYFISGPPIMIKSMKTELISKMVPSNQILTDDWE